MNRKRKGHCSEGLKRMSLRKLALAPLVALLLSSAAPVALFGQDDPNADPSLMEGDPMMIEGDPALLEGDPNALVEGDPSAEGDPAIMDADPMMADPATTVLDQEGTVEDPFVEGDPNDPNAVVEEDLGADQDPNAVVVGAAAVLADAVVTLDDPSCC